MREEKKGIDENRELNELKKLRTELEENIRDIKNKIKIRGKEELIDSLRVGIEEGKACIVCENIIEDKKNLEEKSSVKLLISKLNDEIKKYEEIQYLIIMNEN